MTLRNILTAGAFIILLPVTWWLLFDFFGIQALFVNNIVKEALPENTTIVAQDTITDEGLNNTSSTVEVVPNVKIEPITVSFQQGDSTYAISGELVISNSNTLSLKDFNVTNGPDLYVYLVDALGSDNLSIKSAVDDGAYLSIAPLKGNIGTQNYQLPAGVDLSNYTAVSIWCERFGRNFGYAILSKKR